MNGQNTMCVVDQQNPADPSSLMGRSCQAKGIPALNSEVGSSASGSIRAYVSIARPDHWFKNVFMLLGVVLAYFYYPDSMNLATGLHLIAAVVATCLIASSNYVINEILDASTDLAHPVKRFRPIPCGQVNVTVAYLEWIILGLVGLGMAWCINRPFFYSGALLWIMGLIYNVPPIRSKEHAYIDVLSESINNPIRLLLGWFAVNAVEIPPMSLLISYWMIGAFFMGTKRFAEYRSIAHISDAAAYRSSFRHYDENKLLVSMFFYATASALFLGVFIIRYHLELILGIPLIAGFFGSYMKVALKKESAAQSPEHLYRERGLMIYLVICVVAFVVLMFVRLPGLYEWFNVEPSNMPALWEF